MDEDDWILGDGCPPEHLIDFSDVQELWNLSPSELGRVMETGLLCPVKQDKSKPPALERALGWGGGGDENLFRDVFFELADVLQLEQTHPEVIPHFLDNDVAHDTSERHSRWARFSRPEHSFNSVLMPALNLMVRWKLDVEQLFALVKEKGLPAINHQGQPIQVGPTLSLNPVLMSFRLGDVLLFEQAYPELKDGSVETVTSTSELARTKANQGVTPSIRPSALHQEEVKKIAIDLKKRHPQWSRREIAQHDRVQAVVKKNGDPYKLKKYMQWVGAALRSLESPAVDD